MKFVILLFCLFAVFAKSKKHREDFFLPKYSNPSASLSKAYELQKLTAMKNQLIATETQHYLDRHAEMTALERCELTGGILLQAKDLPSDNRQNGDPCTQDHQCASSLCICKRWGGKECSSALHEALELNYQSWRSVYLVTATQSVDFIRSLVLDPTEGYCKKSLTSFLAFSNHALCGAYTDIGFKMELYWTQDCPKDVTFRIGVDWGRGGWIIFDDQVVTTIIQAVGGPGNWWNGDWSSQYVFSTPKLSVGIGEHSLQFIGFEDANDGDESIQFNTGSTWMTVDDTFSLGPCQI